MEERIVDSIYTDSTTSCAYVQSSSNPLCKTSTHPYFPLILQFIAYV